MCERLLQFLLVESSCDARERRSFQLMEALLYRVQLSLFTGRMESALAILQVGGVSVLSVPDRAGLIKWIN